MTADGAAPETGAAEPHVAAPPYEPADEASARTFGALALARVAWLVETQTGAIERAASLVAAAIANGHRIWVTQTSHTFHLEATHRAGGLMAVDVLEDPESIQAGDAVLLGTSAGTSAGTIQLAITARERGAVLISFSQVAFETDLRIPRDHPSGRVLHELADVFVDLGGPFGDGEFALTGTDVRIIPSSGVTGVVALWMLLAEVVRLLGEGDRVPLVWQSNLLPGAQDRNTGLHREFEATGLGYFTSRVR